MCVLLLLLSLFKNGAISLYTYLADLSFCLELGGVVLEEGMIVLDSMALILEYQLIFSTSMYEPNYTDLDLESIGLPKVSRIWQ